MNKLNKTIRVVLQNCFFTGLALFGLSQSAQAQVNLTATGSAYVQNFDGADLATIQWTHYDVNTDGAANCPAAGNGRWNLITTACQAQVANNIARGGTGKALAYEFSAPNDANDWVFSPSFSLAANKPYKFVYYFRSAGGTGLVEKMKAMITTGNSPANAVAGVPASAPVKDYPNMTSGAYAKDSIMFTPTADGTFYIAFKAESIADQFFIAIDDFLAQNLEVPANDIAVTSITTDLGVATASSCASFTAATAFKIKFKNTGTADQGAFGIDWSIKRLGSPDVTVASGTHNATGLNTGVTDSVTVQGDLTIGGVYTITATAVLANDQVSLNNTATITRFNPLSDLSAQGSVYGQTFTSLLGAGWVANPTATAASGWQLINIGTPANPATFCRRNATNASNDWLFTNCFNLVNGQKYRITYQRMKINSNTATPTSDEKLKFFVSTTGANIAGMTTQLGATGDETISNTTFATITIDYTATMTGIHYFGFQQTSGTTPAGFPATAFAGTAIDNFSILTIPTNDLAIKRATLGVTNACAAPTAGGFSNATQITARVWNAGTAAINTSNFVFKYRVRPRNAADPAIVAETTINVPAANIAAGDTIDLALPTINMLIPRAYFVDLYINNTDGLKANDTLKLGFLNQYRDLTADNSAYNEPFDQQVVGNTLINDARWTFINNATAVAGSDTWGYDNTAGGAASGAVFLSAFTNTTGASNTYAFTPCIGLVGNANLALARAYRLSFKYKASGTQKMKVILCKAPTVAGATATDAIVIKDYPTLAATTGYTTVTFDMPTNPLVVNATGTYYIAFQMYSDASATQSGISLDDVVITNTAVTAIEANRQFNESIKVYPNPTRDSKFTVEMPELQKAVTFTVINAMGNEVYKTKGANAQNFDIKTTGLSKGVYILRIDTAKGQAFRKVVIE